MSYNFIHSDKIDKQAIVEYLTRQFPERFSAEKLYDFWASRDPESYKDIILIKDSETNEIKGITFFSKMSFYFSSVIENQYWAFDLYVDEDMRKDNYGLEFMMWGRNEFQDTYCIGSGPDAQKINLAMGEQNLGEIRKYVGIVNPWWLPFAFISGSDRFPQRVTAPDCVFKEITDPAQLSEYALPYNSDIFEPSRDKEFLKWRFFNSTHSYHFYVRESSNEYFVVREIKFKGMRALVLVDYRINFKSQKFESIYSTLKQIANKIRISIIIAGSSLEATDKVLEAHHFKSIGRPRPFMGPKVYNDFKNRIKSRNFALITLADSDGEIYYE
ncbi:MAG: hypothetical protein ACI31E_07930 [Muribaculaceae bacterium]